LIFTTSHEQESFCKFYFWIKKDKTYVLPLGSSIKSNHDFKQKKIADPLIISYFGLIRPNKGIEDFISLLDIYNKNTVTVKGRIIGKILQSEIQYARKLQTITANLPIEWCLNKSESKVSDLLFETTFTYLPYPDGASLRRSSLLAALSHATFVITTKGSQTPSGLDGIVSYADSPQKAFMVLNGFDYTTSNAEVLVHRTKRFSLAFNWEIIAESHIKLYELVLQKGHNAKAIEDLHQSSLS
jgi:glycosyltransferase involved in cell wall biosynthesis